MMQGRSSSTTLTLLHFVEYDVRGAFRLLCGLFVIGLGFTMLTLPVCVGLLLDGDVPFFVTDAYRYWSGENNNNNNVVMSSSRDGTECSVDLVVYAHWFLLVAFVSVQLLQLPFRFRSFAEIFVLGIRAQTFSRDNLVESFKCVMQRSSWRFNQYLGFLGQYLLPSCGWVILLLLGEKYSENPCDFPKHFHDRPSSVWTWLVGCVIVRIVLTFVWGYHTTNAHFNNLVSLRGATQTMLDQLETFKYTGQKLHLTQCTICISDFEQDESLTRLPCDSKHIFHTACVGQWLKRCKVCPLCMLDIDDPKHRKTT